jgi:protein gp37
MNPTKIEWCDMTWNPAVGCSKRCHDENGKIWCYAYWQAKRMKQKCEMCYKFIPHFHRERLIEPYKRKKPTKIFLCSMGEFFDPMMKSEWQEEILNVIMDNPQHTFISLTKQPQNIVKCYYPRNMWIGMSLNGKYDKISMEDYEKFIGEMHDMINVKFLSLEPYLKEINPDFVKFFDWIIVGGLTGHKKYSPPKQQIDRVVDSCRNFKKPLFIKDNCHYGKIIREFPKVKEYERKKNINRNRRFYANHKTLESVNPEISQRMQ